MPKIVCPGCEQELDVVVLSYGTRTWDEKAQSYRHHEGEDEGDWACPKCGAGVSETRFYPPATGRPFPRTYGDWVNLAEDIKAAAPNDLQLAAQVNDGLGYIATNDPTSSEGAKRMLMQKAGELGIR